MAGYRDIAHFLEEAQFVMGSRHRRARMFRFVFRHRKSHRRLASRLIREQRNHERVVRRRRDMMLGRYVYLGLM